MCCGKYFQIDVQYQQPELMNINVKINFVVFVGIFKEQVYYLEVILVSNFEAIASANQLF